jgi:hypothetical protein
MGNLTTSCTDLDVKSIDTQLLASNGDVLSSQHSSVWGRLVTVCLDFHSSGNTGDGFAATGITQNVSLRTQPLFHLYLSARVEGYLPEIGDVNEPSNGVSNDLN